MSAGHGIYQVQERLNGNQANERDTRRFLFHFVKPKEEEKKLLPVF